MTRLGLASLYLTALAAAAASPLAGAAEDSFASGANAIPESAAFVQRGASDGSPEFGGAIYSPFSSTAVTGRSSGARAATTRHQEDNSGPGLAATAIVAVVGAGVVIALMRASQINR